MSAPSLLRQQQELLTALLDMPVPFATKNKAVGALFTGARGLKAYQSNGNLLAQRALQAAYPVVAQMLGDDSFADLARAFWHTHPPVRGDVAQWGEHLAAFIAGDEQLRPEPYLADVARCEWALHRAAFAADANLQSHTLALLTTHDPAHLRLVLAPGLWCHSSPWPVVSLVAAHQSPPQNTLAQAAELLRQNTPQDAVVWREGLRPQIRQALQGERAFLQSLGVGTGLLAAVEQAPALDFSQWLPLAVQTGLLARIETLDAP